MGFFKYFRYMQHCQNTKPGTDATTGKCYGNARRKIRSSNNQEGCPHKMAESVSALTKLFERRDLDLSVVEPQLQSTINILRKMKVKPGASLSKVVDLSRKYEVERDSYRGPKVEGSRDIFLDHLISNLEERLTYTPTLTNLSSLDLREAGDDSFLTFFGDAQVSELADRFGLDVDQTLTERTTVKLFTEDITDITPHAMLKSLTTLKPLKGALYPDVVKLIGIHATIILSTSEVERVVSQVKLVVTEHRNRLKVSNFNKLLMISLNTDSHNDIDLEAVVKSFLRRKQRRL